MNADRALAVGMVVQAFLDPVPWMIFSTRVPGLDGVDLEAGVQAVPPAADALAEVDANLFSAGDLDDVAVLLAALRLVCVQTEVAQGADQGVDDVRADIDCFHGVFLLESKKPQDCSRGFDGY